MQKQLYIERVRGQNATVHIHSVFDFYQNFLLLKGNRKNENCGSPKNLLTGSQCKI